MRDIALLVILLAFVWLALLRPWLGVLGLAVLGFMHPQGYATGFMQGVPVYLILFAAVCTSLAVHLLRQRQSVRIPWDWRLGLLLGLWGWFAVSSHFSIAPWEAWDKYREVLKLLPPLALTLLLIDTREKLHYLIATVALSILLVALKGGYWAVMTGFQDRVYGPPGSQYADNNEFAVAVAMAIPLLLLWWQGTRDRALRLVLLAGIVLCYGAALSSWSRGGMLALAVMTLWVILHSRRKYLALPLLLVVGAGFFVQLPEEWFARMQTLSAYQQDPSAQGRLAVWRVGLDFVAEHPLTGGGFNAWPALTLSSAGLRDWHSAYIEMLAEHGYVGLGLWLALLLGTILGLGLLRRRRPDPWATGAAALLQASLLAYLVGGLTLGIAYWELPYHLVIMAVLLQRTIPRPGDAGEAGRAP